MSTSQQIITNAIRRMAKTDPDIANAISATKNRGDLAAESAFGSSGGEENRICCDGSTSSNTNPGATQTDPDAGGQSSLDASDPANLSDIAGGSLTGLTDCATGEPVCFEGNDWVPPEGWDGPQEPGPAEGFVEGVYWFARGRNMTQNEDFSVGRFATCFAARGFIASLVGSCALTSLAPCRNLSGGIQCPGVSSYSYTLWSWNCEPESTLDACQYTTENPPLADSWPADGCVNLAIKSGTIVGSKYDPENDGSYSAPMSEIELCDGSGNSVGIKPAANGGWKSIDANNPGDGYLYDSTGTRIARISASEYSDPGV